MFVSYSSRDREVQDHNTGRFSVVSGQDCFLGSSTVPYAGMANKLFGVFNKGH